MNLIEEHAIQQSGGELLSDGKGNFLLGELTKSTHLMSLLRGYDVIMACCKCLLHFDHLFIYKIEALVLTLSL